MSRIITVAALAVAFFGVAAGVIVAQASTATVEVRIQAMRLDDGRVEFALQQREGDVWGDRILPQRRYFPASGSGRWLSSSPVDVSAALPATAAPTSTPAPSAYPFEGEGTLGAVRYFTSRDAITDVLKTFVGVTATYTDDYGLEQDASLVISCDADTGTRYVILGTDEYHSSSRKATVAYRVDSGTAYNNQRWDAFGSLGKNVTPSLLNAGVRDTFVGRLRGGSTLLIRTSETPLLTFDISQLFSTPAQTNIDRCGE